MTHEYDPGVNERDIGPVDDNARKFTLEPLSTGFLDDVRATSFNLTIDWLEMAEETEVKLSRKAYDDGNTQLYRIEKRTVDGNRTSTKVPISQDKYDRLLANSVLRIEKRRHEFKYVQGHVLFDMKYDEFKDSPLRILEVEEIEGEKGEHFQPAEFMLPLTEVSDDPQYTGYHIADMC